MIRACCWLSLLVLTVSGCKAYTERSAPFVGPYTVGRYGQAAAVAGELASDAPKRDVLLLRLEEGAALRAAGQFEASQAAFAEAERWLEYWEDQPGFKLSSGTASMVTNLSVLPYRGRPYDRIMLHTYQSLNALALGDPAGARVYLRRAYESQRKAVQERAKQLEAATEEARANRLDVDRTLESRATAAAADRATAALGALRPYAPYVNPFTEYLQGVFHLGAGVDRADTERALQAFERAAALTPGNSYIERDIEVAREVAQGAAVPPLTYVLIETGRAPRRESMRLDLPLFLVGAPVDYVGVALPQLQPLPPGPANLRVRAGETWYDPAVLADFDSIVGRNLQDEMPSIVTRSLMATASKAALAYGARQGVRDDQAAEVAVRIVTSLFQYAANQADLRTWLTLPKTLSVARFPTPPGGQITIGGPSAGQPIPVRLDPERINVVYIKGVRPGGPLTVSQFGLP